MGYFNFYSLECVLFPKIYRMRMCKIFKISTNVFYYYPYISWLWAFKIVIENKQSTLYWQEKVRDSLSITVETESEILFPHIITLYTYVVIKSYERPHMASFHLFFINMSNTCNPI